MPDAGVLHGDADIVAGRQILGAVAHRAVVAADRDGAAGRHRIARIEDEVHQGKLELAGIDMGGPDRAVDLPFETNAAAQDRRHQAGHGLGQRRQPHGIRPQRLAPRERQHPVDELGAMLGGVARHVEDLPALVVELRPPLEQAQAAQDRGKQIVEIMRQPAGQLADRIEPLRLHQPVFEHSPLGDVEQRAQDLGRAAVDRLRHDALVQEDAVGAVGASPAKLAGIGAPLADALQRLLHGRQIVGMHAAQAETRRRM